MNTTPDAILTIEEIKAFEQALRNLPGGGIDVHVDGILNEDDLTEIRALETNSDHNLSPNYVVRLTDKMKAAVEGLKAATNVEYIDQANSGQLGAALIGKIEAAAAKGQSK